MSGPAVTTTTHYQEATVPRRAVFDDLRVGQWVAWTDGRAADIGRIDRQLAMTYATAPNPEGRYFSITEGECERGEVTILRDAPASPVTVRRDVWDSFERVMNKGSRSGVECIPHDVLRAWRDLRDNAELGDTP